VSVLATLALQPAEPDHHLDTVVLVGGLATSTRHMRVFFTLGAVLASLSGFRPRLWRCLAGAAVRRRRPGETDAIVGCIMWTIAIIADLLQPLLSSRRPSVVVVKRRA